MTARASIRTAIIVSFIHPAVVFIVIIPVARVVKIVVPVKFVVPLFAVMKFWVCWSTVATVSIVSKIYASSALIFVKHFYLL